MVWQTSGAPSPSATTSDGASPACFGSSDRWYYESRSACSPELPGARGRGVGRPRRASGLALIGWRCDDRRSRLPGRAPATNREYRTSLSRTGCGRRSFVALPGRPSSRANLARGHLPCGWTCVGRWVRLPRRFNVDARLAARVAQCGSPTPCRPPGAAGPRSIWPTCATPPHPSSPIAKPSADGPLRGAWPTAAGRPSSARPWATG